MSGSSRREQIESLERVVRLEPGNWVAHLQMGVLYQESNQLDAAISCYRKGLEIESNHPDILRVLASLLEIQGRVDEALPYYQRLCRSGNGDADLLNRLGVLQQQRSRWNEAIEAYEAVLDLDPKNAEAHANLGGLKCQLGEVEKAEPLCSRAVELNPHLAFARNNLGMVYERLGNRVAAERYFTQALKLDPGLVQARANLAELALFHGRLEAAEEQFGFVIRSQSPLARGCRVKQGWMQPRIPRDREEIRVARERLVENLNRLETEGLCIADPYREVGQTPFWLAYSCQNDRPLQERIGRFFMKVCPALEFVAPHCRRSRPPISGARRRVGVLSAYLNDHTIGKLNLGLIQRWDRSRFEVILFRTPGQRGALSRRFEACADKLVALPLDLGCARQRVAQEELDILYYPEIGMHPLVYFLAFSRLAPIQCVTWGHPVTTGLPHLDYFLSAGPMEPEDAEVHYSEALVQFNEINTHYYRPRIPVVRKRRDQLGLPASGHLYVSPQSLFKFHPDYDRVLGEILRRDRRGYLVLINGTSPDWNRLLLARFQLAFPGEVDRVVFLPRLAQDDFFQLCRLADVLLDPIYFAGGNSSLEAFACGAPIITLAGPFMRCRITCGLYSRMGIPDAVAGDPAPYAELACDIVMNADRREDLVRRIEERRHVLFENQAAVKEWNAFFDSVQVRRQI